MISIECGTVFGKWTVLSKAPREGKNGGRRYNCRCICGLEKAVWSYHLRAGHSSSCLSCASAKRPSSNKEARAPRAGWTGHGDISGNFWSSLKGKASKRTGKTKSWDFILTIEDAWDLFLHQNRCCALTGTLLVFADKDNKGRTASLDRIDSTKGYNIDNVQWVHKDINMMKRGFSQEYFIKMCCLVALFSGQKK